MDEKHGVELAARSRVLPYSILAQRHRRRTCIDQSGLLKLSGGAMAWQSSKVGLYDQQYNKSINGKVLYYNKIQGQYLFWIPNRGGHWMVSKHKTNLDIHIKH